uniref:chitinase n=1 Tax=Chrysomya megacephala TaxID=115424 RepID=A0A2P0PAT3_CHRMG|nr:chitinase-like protein [Chrysomya megacephala]
MFIKCLILTILCIIWQHTTVVASERKNVVCYHGTWSTYRSSLGKFDVDKDIDPFLCTHLMYAFFGIEETGELRIIDPYLDLEDNYGRGNIKKFNALKLKNPTLKTMVAVGGWNEGSKKFSIVAADPGKRARFVQSVVQFIQRHGFDGLDLDWEYPNQRHKLTNNDRENYLIWLRELKEGLEPFGYILSAAVGSAEFSAELSYNIPEMVKYLDLINVMAYDLHGPWDPVVGINAPLYAGPLDTTERAKQFNFDAIAKYWINQGAPREKLVMGVPFYGRSFTLADPNNHAVGAPHIGRGLAGQYSVEPGVIGYNELCEIFQNQQGLWHQEWEPSQMVPFAYYGRQWIGYENEKSLALKVDYVKKENLGGIMIWSIESDDFKGVCSKKRYPLLSLINEMLFGKIQSDLIGKRPAAYIPIQQVANVIASTQTLSTNIQCQGKNGYVRDPKNCGKFYFCDNGEVFSFNCPSSLYFDLKSLNCNYSYLVDCKSE